MNEEERKEKVTIERCVDVLYSSPAQCSSVAFVSYIQALDIHKAFSLMIRDLHGRLARMRTLDGPTNFGSKTLDKEGLSCMDINRRWISLRLWACRCWVEEDMRG
ncbi:hypothetical protein LOAG_05365 [Loa loa]|uniref:Uncharacterized protein n=1 Tax=Loa loa TaxID=7209 RepID=A0A1S0U0G7_LOALO|nr:hypothetical protein LOAG_05365 [Loa loa]EFO23118.1 hypothetical protein LOAG_05365 [Loa loa]